MIVNEIYCKTALAKSLLPGLYYALNPYRGCEHACVYCYAPAVLKEKRSWGSFLDVKINISSVLAKELKYKKRATVGIGTVTDAYQPLEKRYELTRKCLLQLLRYDFPISIQTKSSLILRDLSLLRKFSECDVGITITTLDDKAREKYEPFSSSINERFYVLEKLSLNNIESWVFLGPIMPFITDKNNELENLIKELADLKVSKVIVDKLRLKKGIWKKLSTFISESYPELLSVYKNLLFSKSEYFENVYKQIKKLCQKYKLRYESAF